MRCSECIFGHSFVLTSLSILAFSSQAILISPVARLRVISDRPAPHRIAHGENGRRRDVCRLSRRVTYDQMIFQTFASSIHAENDHSSRHRIRIIRLLAGRRLHKQSRPGVIGSLLAICNFYRA